MTTRSEEDGMPMRPKASPEVRAFSGRAVSELTVSAVVDRVLDDADIRISAEQLHAQADTARRAGNPSLAENLERAAELTALSEAQLLDFYELLRPGRADLERLEHGAAILDAVPAPRCAQLVREAAVAYKRRGLLRRPST
jgi:propanediol dehydratase small subunit